MKSMCEEIQKDMKQQILSLEQAQKETQKQLEELLKYRSKTMGMLMRTT
jgi:Mg/Co/Ni transporter MgtE